MLYAGPCCSPSSYTAACTRQSRTPNPPPQPHLSLSSVLGSEEGTGSRGSGRGPSREPACTATLARTAPVHAGDRPAGQKPVLVTIPWRQTTRKSLSTPGSAVLGSSVGGSRHHPPPPDWDPHSPYLWGAGCRRLTAEPLPQSVLWLRLAALPKARPRSGNSPSKTDPGAETSCLSLGGL